MLQAQIPSGLQALMQASQILQQESQPVVQTPAGPQPTVAGMVGRGLQQIASQKVGMPQGMMSPAVREVGQQAGIGAQIMAQQQAQQQQMAQDPRAIAQMAAQMVQQPQAGIDKLPVNMQFKEGGIIGFAGEERSYVSPEEGEEAKPKERITAAEIAERVAQFLKSTSPIYQVSEAAGRQARGGKSIEEYYAPKTEQVAPPARSAGISEAAMAQGRAPMPAAGVEQVMRDYKPRRPVEAPVAPAPVAAPAAPRPVAPTGIATAVPAEIAKPSVDVAAAAAERFAPAKPIQDIITGMRERAGQREKDIAAMPDLDQAGIAAIEKASAERERLRQFKAERDQINRTLAFFKDLGRRGSAAYESTQEAIDAREEAARTAALNEEQAIIKHRAAQQARALGKYERADALDKEVLGHLEKLRSAQVQAAKIGADIDTTRYQSDVQFASQRLSDASRERDTARQIAARSAELAQTKDGQLLNTAQSKVTDLIRTESNFIEKNKMILAMAGDPKLMKDPTMQKQVSDVTTQLGAIRAEIQQAQMTRDNLFYKVYGRPPEAAKPVASPQGAPKVGEVRQGYKFKGGDPGNQSNWEKVK